MGYYDELDDEIDQEMGWKNGKGKGKAASPRRGPDYWQAILKTARASSPLWRGIAAIVRGFCKITFFPIISPLAYSKKFDVQGNMVVAKRSILWRLIDAVLTRALLTPVFLAVFMVAIVYASTHPRTVHANATPDSFGIYFKRVEAFTTDHHRLAAWYLPPINADEVNFDPEGSLTQKWPAVVLAHGLGASHDQYLQMAKELHIAGFGVLMLDMRGEGESDPATVTYGLLERLDVEAAVKLLRETPYVDETKICLVGHDIGASAVLQAAAADPAINAVVADGLWPSFKDRAREIFTRPDAEGILGPWSSASAKLPTQWLAPLYTVTFQIWMRDHLEQLDPEIMARGVHNQPVLFIARTGNEYLPLKDLQALATSSGNHNEFYADNPLDNSDSEVRVREFLMKATGWKGPKAHGAEQIENLLKNQVK